ncbi:hypothetical protein IFM89_004178 [Coptis chinensis]|uniref:Amidohydrolase-related domain-containing protein n=1 Tax=Coptis chinensis TaxID=261450 RepID=A0A835HAK8_9MAGN|nr:hypothetical protein IFM89_004178 [Coptis chinensis]
MLHKLARKFLNSLSFSFVQLVGFDHCTFNSTQKALGIDDFEKIPNGANGLDMIEICSAQIFNIYPRKGAILAGSDADIIIFGPNSSFKISSRSHHSRSDTNVYEGRRGKSL